MNVGALVTLIAAVHYFYMREFWVTIHMSPIVFRYLGEALIIDPWIGFIVGICGWFFILFEVFAGEGGKVKGDIKSEAVQTAFGTMRFIVSVGWCIYPAGYFFGYLLGAVSSAPLNLIYNLADFVNKIWFCLAIWAAARKETLDRSKTGSLTERLVGA